MRDWICELVTVLVTAVLIVMSCLQDRPFEDEHNSIRNIKRIESIKTISLGVLAQSNRA